MGELDSYGKASVDGAVGPVKGCGGGVRGAYSLSDKELPLLQGKQTSFHLSSNSPLANVSVTLVWLGYGKTRASKWYRACVTCDP